MSSESLASIIEQLERQLIQPDLQNLSTAEGLLADGFIEIGSSGTVYSKSSVLAAMCTEDTVRRSLTDIKLRVLTDNVVLLTYRACRHTNPLGWSMRSSIWERRNGRWQITFHQGTPAQAPVAAP